MNFRNKYARCPYYIEKDKMTSKLECEGEIPEVRTSVHNFASKEDALEYFKQYCCKNYHECKYAQKISEKYDFTVT